MDLNKAKILLEKINSLYKSIRLDDGELAAIERDLMLSYLRQLYALFREAEGRSAGITPAQPAREERPEPPAPETPAPEPPEEKPARKPAPAGKERPYSPPRIIEIPESIKELTAQVAAAKEKSRVSPKPKPKPPAPEPPTPKPPSPGATDNPAPSRRRPSPEGEEELDELWPKRRAVELSERLSLRPVDDLNKALAINDRLLYVNQLFGKDTRALENALRLLNQQDSFEEAKTLLARLAREHRWTDGARLGTARDFVKLVQRRYL